MSLSGLLRNPFLSKTWCTCAQCTILLHVSLSADFIRNPRKCETTLNEKASSIQFIQLYCGQSRLMKITDQQSTTNNKIQNLWLEFVNNINIYLWCVTIVSTKNNRFLHHSPYKLASNWSLTTITDDCIPSSSLLCSASLLCVGNQQSSVPRNKVLE